MLLASGRSGGVDGSSGDDVCVEVLGILGNLSSPEIDFHKIITELQLLPFILDQLKVSMSRESGGKKVRGRGGNILVGRREGLQWEKMMWRGKGNVWKGIDRSMKG